MTFSINDIVSYLEFFFWPFVRVSALFLASPFFGARTVPVRIRIILAVTVTLVLTGTLEYQESIDIWSAAGLLTMIQQVLIGLGMGIVIQLSFAALVMAGHTIATTMGLGFASTVDPQNGVQVTILGQFYLILATLFFLSIDGHLYLINILAISFEVMPVGPSSLSVNYFWDLVSFSSQMFLVAVLIALPVMTGVLLVNLGFGVMTKAAPQLNMFAMGFPITMLVGFILMLLSLPVLMPLLTDSFSSSFGFLRGQFN